MAPPFWQVPGAEPRPIDIRNHLMATRQNSPIFLGMPGTSDLFLPVFSTVEKLTAWLALLSMRSDATKQIDHPGEFLASIPLYYDNKRVRVIVDPYFTQQGTVRYREIQR